MERIGDVTYLAKTLKPSMNVSVHNPIVILEEACAGAFY